MSTLHAILFFVGLPLLIFSLITLLVMAPSLAKGPRYRPSQQWDAEAEWFGARDVEGGSATPALESAQAQHRRPDGSGDDTGGASASW
jgi:hypothetical protein